MKQNDRLADRPASHRTTPTESGASSNKSRASVLQHLYNRLCITDSARPLERYLKSYLANTVLMPFRLTTEFGRIRPPGRECSQFGLMTRMCVQSIEREREQIPARVPALKLIYFKNDSSNSFELSQTCNAGQPTDPLSSQIETVASCLLISNIVKLAKREISEKQKLVSFAFYRIFIFFFSFGHTTGR